MSTSRWFLQVQEEYSRARRELEGDQAGYPADPLFWELPFSLSQEAIASAAKALAPNLGVRDAAPAQASCFLLFYILRTRLTDVRGNYLWPAVARELTVLSGQAVSPLRAGDFFRNAIGRAYWNHLEGAHNKYVRLALYEAGVGKDRSRIIGQFLEALLSEAAKAERSGLGYEAWVDGFLTRFTDFWGSPDVEALATVLHRSGVALLRLVTDVRTSGVSADLALWDWSTLKSYWLERSGVDLDRLIPEAQQVFSELLHRIGDVVTRQGLARIATEARFSVQFPAAVGPVRFGLGDRSLPLAPVRLVAGNALRDATVSDEFGLTAADVIQYPADQWQLIGSSSLLCWRKEPFEVHLVGRASESSVAIATGGCAEAAHLEGFYWVGRTETGLPQIEGVAPYRGTPELRIEAQWYVTPQRFLKLERFHVAFSDYTGMAAVTINDQEIWSGKLTYGVPEPTRAPREVVLDSSQPSASLVLRSPSGQILARTVLRSPFAQDALLAVAGVLQNTGDVHLDEWPRPDLRGGVLLITRIGSQVPNITGGSFVDHPMPVALDKYAIRRIQPDHDLAAVEVSQGTFKWRILRRTGIEIKTTAGDATVPDGICVSGLGGLLPVVGDDPLEVTIQWPAGSTTRDLFGCSLELTAGTTSHRWPLSVLAGRVSLGGNQSLTECKFGLRDWSSTEGFTLPLGLITLAVRSGPTTHQVSYFRLGSTKVVPGQFGMRAQLTADIGGGHPLCIHSEETVGVADAQRMAGVSGTYYASAGQALTFQWTPKFDDAVLVQDGDPVPEDAPVTLTTLQRGCTIFSSSGESNPWSLQLGESVIHLPPGLASEPLAAALGEAPPLRGRAKLSNASLTHEWALDLAPADLRVTTEWLADNQLRVDLLWFGLPAHVLQIGVQAENLLVAVPTTTPKGSGEGPGPQACSLTFSVNTFIVPRGSPVQLEVSCLGMQLAAVPIEIPATQHEKADTAAEIKGAIKILLRSLPGKEQDDDVALEQLAYLAERYIRETGQLPFPIDTLTSRVGRSGSPPVSGSVVSILFLLDALTHERLTPLDISGPAGSGSLTALWLTLAAVFEVRMGTLGQARPSMLDHLAAQLQALRPTVSGTVGNWVDAVEAFCAREAARLRKQRWQCSSAAWVSSSCKVALANPLVGFDPGLTRFLNEMADGKETCKDAK